MRIMVLSRAAFVALLLVMLPGPGALAVPDPEAGGGNASTVPAAAAEAVAAPEAKPVAPAPPVITLNADINLTSQQLTVSSGGKVLHVWPISSGRAGYETPRGTFRPQWAARMHYSRKYDDAPMPHSVFFNGGVATHGTHATGLLGRPASHGCVRLSPSAAATFYSLVHKHGFRSTRIVVHGSPRFRSEVASRRYREDDRRRMVYRTMPGYAGYGYPPPAYGYGYAAPRRVYVRPRPGYMPVY